MSIETHRLLLQAEEFRRAGIRLESQTGTPPKFDEHCVVPMVVCFSFAMELYLKFLIVTQNGTKADKIHNLKALFESLPSDVADRIRHKWDNPNETQKMRRRAAGKETKKRYGTFDEILERSANAFQKMRYAHESDLSVFEWKAGDIMECCRRTIFEIYPTDYAESRLPLPYFLPPGQSLPMGQHILQHPLRQPRVKRP